jgi:hypothetical protein
MRRLMTGVCALGLWGAAQASAQTVAFPVRVAAGDDYTVTIDIDQDLGPTLPGQRLESRSVYDLDIETPTRWQFTPTRLEFSNLQQLMGASGAPSSVDIAALNDAMSAMVRLATDVGFECRVDVRGQCADMTNWSTWSSRIENFALVADGFARVGLSASSAFSGAGETVGRPPGPKPQTVDEAERQAALDAAAERYDDVSAGVPSNPFSAFDYERHRVPILQAVAALIDGFDSRAAASGMASFGLLALPQGRTLTVGAQTTFADQWAMPFNAPPIRMNGVLTLESVDRAAGVATVLRTATLDEDSMRAALRGMAAYLGGPVMEPLRPLLPEGQQVTPEMISAMTEMVLAFADIDVSETTRGQVDLRTGLIRTAETTYVVRIAGQGAALLGGAAEAPIAIPEAGAAVDESGGDGKPAPQAEGEAEDDAPREVSITIRQRLSLERGDAPVDRLPRAQ